VGWRGYPAVSAVARAAVVAIDGGNSKTDVALVSAEGDLLARTRGRAALAPEIGIAASLRIIGELVESAANDAGLVVGAGPLAHHTAAYLAGVDIAQEQVAMHAALCERGWSSTVGVDNDTFAIFRAGTTSHWGIGVVAGAGMNAVGIGRDGRVGRYLALGETTGDFGGGNDLSNQVLYWAFRAEDGRGGPTALSSAVCEHFGLPTVYDVVLGMHRGDITKDQRLDLTRVLFKVAAETDDPVAVSLLERQAREVALMARQLLRELDLINVETDVVLGGGVLTSRDPLLTTLIGQRMAVEAPKGRVIFNEVPAVTGAALLGFDHLGIGRAAEDRLRSQMRSPTAASSVG
jgi:N-acetylglucosamine kinase-like BadF-type ATPase